MRRHVLWGWFSIAVLVPAAVAAVPATHWARLDAPGPPARAGHALAYHAELGAIVLVGGHDASSFSFDTWLWHDGEWKSGFRSLPTRSLSAMAYDAAARQVVLFGGLANRANRADTWAFGRDWVEVSPGEPSPGPRWGHSMASNPGGGVVLFGGFATTFDASGNPTSASIYQETWVWRRARWSAATPSEGSPDHRGFAVMSYDAEREVVVLFGGYGLSGHALGDTWEWNGSTWTVRETATERTPPARHSAAMTYDRDRHVVVLFGGYDGARELGDLWEWDGRTWTEIDPEAPPQARSGGALAFDEAAHASILVGGGFHSFGFNYLDDTWKYFGERSHYGCSAALGPAGPVVLLVLVVLWRRRGRRPPAGAGRSQGPAHGGAHQERFVPKLEGVVEIALVGEARLDDDGAEREFCGEAAPQPEGGDEDGGAGASEQIEVPRIDQDVETLGAEPDGLGEQERQRQAGAAPFEADPDPGRTRRPREIVVEAYGQVEVGRETCGGGGRRDSARGDGGGRTVGGGSGDRQGRVVAGRQGDRGEQGEEHWLHEGQSPLQSGEP